MRFTKPRKGIIEYLRRHRTRATARLDVIQSSTGLILAIFIMGHLLFEASILISKEAMYNVTQFFEGYYFFGEHYPGIISFLAAGIFVIFIVHALTAMRKFPSSYRQYRIYRDHMKYFKHTDSTLWFYQIVTGFAMFFLGSVHLYMMMAQPSNIGPYASADRIYTDWMWPLYLLLLISVILHAFIGLYRLALKWGAFGDKNRKANRAALKKVMVIAIVVYMIISLASLATYMMIGAEHADHYGERYVQEAHQ
jgi:fumarate reductase subunit C